MRLEECTCGLYSWEDEIVNEIPLKGVFVEAQIVENVAKVTITQLYHNQTENSLECRYIFPIDSNSSVCDFSAEIGDDFISAVIKERTEAISGLFNFIFFILS